MGVRAYSVLDQLFYLQNTYYHEPGRKSRVFGTKVLFPFKITLPLMGLALTSSVFIGMVLLGLWSTCNSLTVVNGISLRQSLTPDHLRSRVNTTARVVGIAGIPLGAMVGGLIAQGATIQMTYLIMAGGVTLSALLGWFTPLRQFPSVQITAK